MGSVRATRRWLSMQSRLGDDGQPRVEAALAGEAGHGRERTGEGLLRDLLGLVDVADAASAEPQKPGVVAVVEVAEGALVAGLAKLDQASVPNEIDIVCTDGHLSPQPTSQHEHAGRQGSQFSRPFGTA